MATTSPTPKRQHIGKPNEQAVSEFLDAYFYWKAKKELAKRAKKLRGRNRAAAIKI